MTLVPHAFDRAGAALMSEFNYGDPHPGGIDLRQGKDQVDRRTVKVFARILEIADKLYERGGEGVAKSLALFDREAQSIRYWFAWAVSSFIADEADILAAQMCRGYALRGIDLIDLRFPAAEKMTWMEAAVKACRRLEDRRGEASALNNLGNACSDLGEARQAVGLYEQHLRWAIQLASAMH